MNDDLVLVGEEIEVVARAIIGFAEEAVAQNDLNPDLLPEALLLAAVELAGKNAGSAADVANWLASVAERIRTEMPASAPD